MDYWANIWLLPRGDISTQWLGTTRTFSTGHWKLANRPLQGIPLASCPNDWGHSLFLALASLVVPSTRLIWFNLVYSSSCCSCLFNVGQNVPAGTPHSNYFQLQKIETLDPSAGSSSARSSVLSLPRLPRAGHLIHVSLPSIVTPAFHKWNN